MNIGIHVDGYATTRNTEDGPVEFWQTTFSICATSVRGEVWALIDSTVTTEAEAEFLLRGLDHSPDSNPEAWVPCSPVYGSEAWGQEDEYALACFEADAYNEPRPNW